MHIFQMLVFSKHRETKIPFSFNSSKTKKNIFGHITVQCNENKNTTHRNEYFNLYLIKQTNLYVLFCRPVPALAEK
jgi:hypothetical protein